VGEHPESHRLLNWTPEKERKNFWFRIWNTNWKNFIDILKKFWKHICNREAIPVTYYFSCYSFTKTPAVLINERGPRLLLRRAEQGERIMQKFKTLFRKPELQRFVACLVLLIFSWPILTILESTGHGFVFFYLFGAWGVVIVLLLLIAVSHRKSGSEQAAESESEV
jgi:hypothetical protein